MRRVKLLILSMSVPALLIAGPAASADVFEGISLVSEAPGVQQAEYGHDPAISGDGRYVTFDGSYGGVTGVWRRDLLSGAVEQVAGGDAELPSISENGRYISFTTTAALAPGDHNVGPDVYVRDMSLEASQPGAFTLASAVNGSEEGLRYAASSAPASYGALAAGRSALSADGRKVAFVTTAVSNLLAKLPSEPPETPAMQVAVRDLDAHTTQLVSVASPASAEPAAVSGVEGTRTFGAVYEEGEEPPRFKPIEAFTLPAATGASISADGSTVAWLAQDVGSQAPTLPAETLLPRYTEPLWRRIADGPLAPTRRVTGGSDPANPACSASGETALSGNASSSDPCQGPFSTFVESNPGTWTGGLGDALPRLSADGYTVAFLADAPLVALGSNFGRGENNSDLYVADMHEGLTRVQALRPLTELASGDNTNLATNAPIVDLGISADGSKVAFTTKRTVFPLGSPAYVSAPAAVPGMVELFDIDLADDTLTRVTHGFEGGASEHPHNPRPTGEDPYSQPADGALSPSYSSSGETLAFSSTAANLVFGDGNTPPLGHESKIFDGSDAFVVARELFGSTPTGSYVSSAPPGPAITPTWRLGVTAFSRRDGSVVLDVMTPAAGTLKASAKSGVILTSRRRGSHGRRAKVAIRAVATRAGHSSGAGLVTLTLQLAHGYTALASKHGGLSSTVSLLFASAGRPTLREAVDVTFLRRARTPAKRASTHGRSSRRGPR
jgi:hypothetical protein